MYLDVSDFLPGTAEPVDIIAYPAAVRYVLFFIAQYRAVSVTSEKHIQNRLNSLLFSEKNTTPVWREGFSSVQQKESSLFS